MTEEALLAFLKKRVGLLDGVCITGGEPTLYGDLAPLLRQIKALGYLVKLDTNGSSPEVLKALAGEGLVDYVAMDVKNCSRLYGTTVGVEKLALTPVEESLRFLISGDVDYELRTTVVAQLHDRRSMEEMGQWLSSLVSGRRPERLFLQCFRDGENVLTADLQSPTAEELTEYQKILTPYIGYVGLRGIT